MNNIKYLNGCMKSNRCETMSEKLALRQLKIQSAEAELNSSLAAFDSVRTSYLADLTALRDVYKPAFQILLSDIKKKKANLEKLSESTVIFNE